MPQNDLYKLTITDNNVDKDIQVESAICDEDRNNISDTYTKREDIEVTQLGYTTRETRGRTTVNVFHPEAEVDPTDGKDISFDQVAWTGDYNNLKNTPHLFKYTIKIESNDSDNTWWDFITTFVSSEDLSVGHNYEEFDTAPDCWTRLFSWIGNNLGLLATYDTEGQQNFSYIGRFTNDLVNYHSREYHRYYDTTMVYVYGTGGYSSVYQRLCMEDYPGRYVLRYDSGDEDYELHYEIIRKDVII